MKREEERETMSLPSTECMQDCTSWGWHGPKPGTKVLKQVLYVRNRTILHEPHPASQHFEGSYNEEHSRDLDSSTAHNACSSVAVLTAVGWWGKNKATLDLLATEMSIKQKQMI